MSTKIEPMAFESLPFTNNFLFTRIMEENPDLCVDLTELVLGRKVRGFKKDSLGKEHAVKITPDSKGVRLDLYFEDSDALYDIEMQTTSEPDLPRRYRYYQDMTDMAALDAGQEYGALPESYIVFLCTFDPFGEGHVKYEFQNYSLHDKPIPLGDGTKKVAICAFGKEAENDPTLNAFLKFMSTNEPTDDFTNRLCLAMNDAKRSAKNRSEYMSYEMDRLRYGNQQKEEGRAEGRAEGHSEGLSEGKSSTMELFQLIQNGEADDVIISKLACSEDDIQKARAILGK